MGNVNLRVQKHRDALRRAGLRPVQLWVPDTRSPHFADECRRQSLMVTEVDQVDAGLEALMDQAALDVGGWQK